MKISILEQKGISISRSFGFYPAATTISLATFSPVQSIIVNDGKHEFNASVLVEISKDDFLNAQNVALNASKRLYDLNNYNCTNFALEVFNAAVPQASRISIPDWIGLDGLGFPIPFNFGKTPNKLFLNIFQKQNLPNVFVGKMKNSNDGPCN